MDISPGKSPILLEKISDATNVNELSLVEISSIMTSDDYLAICDVLEVLASFIAHDEIKKIFIDMTRCENPLVRCTACESLRHIYSIDTVFLLMEILKKEKTSTVRTYVLSSLCYIVKVGRVSIDDFLPELKVMYSKEKANEVIIGYCALFFVCGKDIQYLNMVSNYLSHKNYHIRCNAINFLYEMSDDNCKVMIINKFKKIQQIEKTGAVRSLLSKYLEA